MTFEYRDSYGRVLTVAHGLDDDDNPMAVLWARGEFSAQVPIRIPASHVEEVVAGLRDAARTAAARQTTGQADTDEQRYTAEVVQAAQRAHNATPKCPNCGHLWQHHGDEVCGVRSRHQGAAYHCGCIDAEEDHAPAVGQPAEAQTADGSVRNVIEHALTVYYQDGSAPSAVARALLAQHKADTLHEAAQTYTAEADELDRAAQEALDPDMARDAKHLRGFATSLCRMAEEARS